MTEFNSMTVVAAAELIEKMSTLAEFTTLVLGWGVEKFCESGSVATKSNNLAKLALQMPQEVMTVHGRCDLSRAMVEHAVTAPSEIILHSAAIWSRFVAGLRFDGFEIVEEIVPDPSGRPSLFDDCPRMIKVVLKRMLPEDIPGTDFREAESELEGLLDRLGFDVPKGHLTQAIVAFQRGEWSSANGELRNFYESYLNEIANGLGYNGVDSSKARRDFLGTKLDPPFLLADYNEWDAQKTQFVQGLMNRMHPHGGHPGLSEEEDATFRLQISLVTARLFLRRYSKRLSG